MRLPPLLRARYVNHPRLQFDIRDECLTLEKQTTTMTADDYPAPTRQLQNATVSFGDGGTIAAIDRAHDQMQPLKQHALGKSPALTQSEYKLALSWCTETKVVELRLSEESQVRDAMALFRWRLPGLLSSSGTSAGV
jgi:hypothetical protein